MKKIGLIFVVLNLIVIDVELVHLVYKTDIEEKHIEQNTQPTELNQNLNTIDSCGPECQKYIDEKISSVSNLLKSITPGPTATTSKNGGQQTAVTTRSKIKSVVYLPISGSGSTLQNDWASVTGTDFYMTKNDYQGLTGVYFEANVKLLNGNGKAYVRLFDITHSIGVDGSELFTTSQLSAFLTSGAINLWEGYNHYVVQIKSLTADTAVFDSGRLKIITEN